MAKIARSEKESYANCEENRGRALSIDALRLENKSAPEDGRDGMNMADEQQVATAITFEQLRGVIGREKLDPNEEPALGPSITVSTGKWKKFDIEVFRKPQMVGGVETITLIAQVPLKPKAVQICIIGEVGREEELRELLRSVLAKLDGDTNWFTRSERVEAIFEGCASLLLIGFFLRSYVRSQSKLRRNELKK